MGNSRFIAFVKSVFIWRYTRSDFLEDNLENQNDKQDQGTTSPKKQNTTSATIIDKGDENLKDQSDKHDQGTTSPKKGNTTSATIIDKGDENSKNQSDKHDQGTTSPKKRNTISATIIDKGDENLKDQNDKHDKGTTSPKKGNTTSATIIDKGDENSKNQRQDLKDLSNLAVGECISVFHGTKTLPAIISGIADGGFWVRFFSKKKKNKFSVEDKEFYVLTGDVKDRLPPLTFFFQGSRFFYTF